MNPASKQAQFKKNGYWVQAAAYNEAKLDGLREKMAVLFDDQQNAGIGDGPKAVGGRNVLDSYQQWRALVDETTIFD